MKRRRRTLPWLHRYFRHIGGWRSIGKSKYVWASVFLTALSAPGWTLPGWWEMTISVVPALLGLSLAAFAILQAFANGPFLLHLRKARPPRPPSGPRPPNAADQTNARFVHFIILQTLALIAAVVCKMTYVEARWPISGLISYVPLSLLRAGAILCWSVGFWLFAYALLSIVATTGALYNFITSFQRFTAKTARLADLKRNNQEILEAKREQVRLLEEEIAAKAKL